MPTFILFKDGQKVKELVGANPAGLQVRSPPLSQIQFTTTDLECIVQDLLKSA